MKRTLSSLPCYLNQDKADHFYGWQVWKDVRRQVLHMDHYECQICKAKGRYRRATLVHHVKHLKDRPDLALAIWDGEERQLISVCKHCHEALHPEQLKEYRKSSGNPPLTEERWD